MMNEKYEKWLDERLKEIVDSGRVEFDSEQWKQKYSEEYQALVSRAAKRPNVLRVLWGHPLAKAAAVVAVIALVVFLRYRRPDKQVEPVVIRKAEQPILRGPERIGTASEDKSPVRMMSRLSLTLAYNRGGIEAVDQQCKRAFELLGQENTNISINELFNENNGKEPERKDL
jgi:hypothetical protein